MGIEWTDTRTPEPKRGSNMIYCPHATVETVKVPKKRAKQVIVNCKFKTHNIRKYRRHYIRTHGELAPAAATAGSPVGLTASV